MSKTYIKLEPLEAINFVDNVSYMDYENFRTDFYNRNRLRDTFMDYSKTKKIPGLEAYNSALIKNEEPYGVNMSIIHSILLMVQKKVTIPQGEVNPSTQIPKEQRSLSDFSGLAEKLFPIFRNFRLTRPFSHGLQNAFSHFSKTVSDPYR